MRSLLSIIFAAAVLTGCEHMPENSPAKQPAKFDYASVMVKDDRPEKDYEDYEIRKVQSVLEFTGVKPGMSVLEMEAGHGFYTELFSKIVGDEGQVFMQNPASFDTFLKEGLEARNIEQRLPNVTYVKSNFDAEMVEPGSADIVTWFLGPHELWWTPEGEKANFFGTPENSFAAIARSLKSGGTLIVLDHSAPGGAPTSTGGDTHRIDQAVIIDLAAQNGMELIESSDLFANADDDRTVMVFDPSVRRKTDRFLLKFSKK